MARRSSNKLRGAFFALAKAALEGRLEISECLANTALEADGGGLYAAESPVPKPSASSSASVIAFARILARPFAPGAAPTPRGRVVVKMWLGPENRKKHPCFEVDALVYETFVYKRILKRVLGPGLSTNFVPFIAYASCNRDRVLQTTATRDLFGRTTSPFASAFAKLAEEYATVCDTDVPNKARFLVTQSACDAGNCTPLFNLLRQQTTQPARLNVTCIFFTLVWALHVMQKYAGVQHNDLHSANVLLRDPDPDRPTFAYAPAADEIYVVPREWMPRQAVIFDWDHASVDDSSFFDGKRNPMLDGRFCEDYGQCARRDDRYDLYTLLCNMLHCGVGSAGYDAALRFLNNDQLRDVEAAEDTYHRHLEERNLMTNVACGRRNSDVDAWLPTPREMLSRFADLRLESVARTAPDALADANRVRVFAEPHVDANAVRERIRAVARRTGIRVVAPAVAPARRTGIQVVPSMFTKHETAGDFVWMIRQPEYQRALFVFNDNESQFERFLAGDMQSGCNPGGGNAAIRPYQCETPRLAAGIPTGSIHGGGYTTLTPKVKTVIDRALTELGRVIEERGDVDRIYYSAKRDGGLGTGIFEVGDDVKKYIVDGIRRVAALY